MAGVPFRFVNLQVGQLGGRVRVVEKSFNEFVVHCKKEHYDVYVGRPSKWGNPFVVGKHGKQGECVELFREWIVNQDHLLAQLDELKGKVLGCWCSPKACHGHVLAELANS